MVGLLAAAALVSPAAGASTANTTTPGEFVVRRPTLINLEFELRRGSAAIDRAWCCPTVADRFNGKAPDLGALELGKPTPIYCPRSR